MIDEERSTNVGRAQGGPLDGELVSSRFPKGLLVVDKPGDRAWVYDWNGTAFVCRDDEPRALDNDKRLAAAVEYEYDVRAYEPPSGVVVEGQEEAPKTESALTPSKARMSKNATRITREAEAAKEAGE